MSNRPRDPTPRSTPTPPAETPPALPVAPAPVRVPTDALSLLLSDWGALGRLGVALAGLAAILAALLLIGVRVLRENKLEVVQTSSGLVYRAAGHDLLVTSLPASAHWTSSGYAVHKGQKVDIRASGRIHLALHRLVDAARSKRRPGLPWVGPDGIPIDAPLDDAALRAYLQQNCVLLPTARQGSLLAAIASPAADPGTLTPIAVGRHLELEAPSDGELWFVVNDTWFDASDRSRRCYEHAPRNDDLGMTFDQIVAERYWNAWFDDNVGEFLVTVRGLD